MNLDHDLRSWLFGGLCLSAAAVCAQPAVPEAPADPGLWESTRSWAGNLLGGEGTEVLPELWTGIVPKLESTLDYVDRHDTLPERTWFGDDQGSNQRIINDLLDESIGILSLSSTQHFRQRIRELEQAIVDAREDIADYRKQRVAAPQESLWRNTVADYDARIVERQGDIRAHEQEIVTLKQRFAAELKDMGLELSEGQLDFLLSTVIGDDLIEMSIAFDNVKLLTGQLEKLMEQSEGDLDSARRYYGMYAVLLKVLGRMHQQLLDEVDQRYLPEIDAITAKTQSLMARTGELLQGEEQSRAVLEANLQAQELTLRTAEYYRQYLLDQAVEVAKARDALARDIAVAENTYETVKVSGELVALIRTTRQLLNTLLVRQTPPLRTFENLEMKREFERLTAQLRDAGAT